MIIFSLFVISTKPKIIEKQNPDCWKQMHKFLLELDKMLHITYKEFETLKWLLKDSINAFIQLFLSILMHE